MDTMHARYIQETCSPLSCNFLFAHVLNDAAHGRVSTVMMVILGTNDIIEFVGVLYNTTMVNSNIVPNQGWRAFDVWKK